MTLHAEVDAQLLEHGAFSPLELLFSSGRLFQGDYDAWRRREVEFLDSVLMGNSAKIREELERAATYARSLGLEAQVQEFQGEGAADGGGRGPLRLSADPHWHQLIASRFVPARQAPQLDLFVDNPVVALTTGLVRALAMRDLADAQRRLDRLYEQAPNHPDLPAYDRLLAGLTTLSGPALPARSRHDLIVAMAPAARRLLGSHARELLVPLWRALAADAAPFSPEAPELHASHALAQAQDFAGVEEAVLAVPEWWRHAPLCLRLTESAFQRKRRIGGLSAWCRACWRAPAEGARMAASLKITELTLLWQAFLDEEPLEEPAGGALTDGDFPAWLLLHEPGLAQQLPESLAALDTRAEDGYRLVHRWLTARRGRRRDEELAVRRQLQGSHAPLFRLLKRTLGTAVEAAPR